MIVQGIVTRSFYSCSHREKIEIILMCAFVFHLRLCQQTVEYISVTFSTWLKLFWIF